MKLHLGCGRNHVNGYVNVDSVPGPLVDAVVDLDACPDFRRDDLWIAGQGASGLKTPLPWPDNSVTESFGEHVIEHLRRPMEFMQELWRVSEHGAVAEFATPYGSSDDAWEDPTHVRPYFVGSWMPFAQPYYWRADYGYRADWLNVRVIVDFDAATWEGAEVNDMYRAMQNERNAVHQMTAELVCVKPARPAERELLTPPKVEFRLVETQAAADGS